MSDISRLELTKLNGKPLRVQLIALLAICLLLTDILIEIAKGLTMGYLQWKLKEKSSLQEAIEAHAGQERLENISFWVTIITTGFSVCQDTDESVIALVKGDYHEQIKVIVSRIGNDYEDNNVPGSGSHSFWASFLRRSKRGI